MFDMLGESDNPLGPNVLGDIILDRYELMDGCDHGLGPVAHGNLGTVVQQQIGKSFRHAVIALADVFYQIKMLSREINYFVHEGVGAHAFLLQFVQNVSLLD